MNEKALKVLEYPKIIQKLTDYAASQPGKQLCRDLTPSSDPGTIRRMQTETSDAVSRLLRKGNISFSGLTDIRGSLRRLEIGSSLNIEELLRVCRLLETTLRVKSWARSARNEAENAPEDSLESMFSGLQPLSPLSAEISRCILSEDEIADDASPGLRQVRRQIHQTNDRIRVQLNSLVNGSARTYLQDAVVTQRNGRFCLPVKAEYRGQVPGMIHDQSSTGSTLFIEPMSVVRLNNDLRELEIKEEKEIEIVLANLSSLVAAETDALNDNILLLTELDFIFARAQLSLFYRGSEPDFNEEGRIRIKKGRHPLIDPKKVVPVDIRIGEDFTMLVISGPNTGGKTVSLKTVGLFTLLGQSGLHIPASDHSELSVFDEVYADIGDEQSIEQSLSTFSAHMTNLISILNEVKAGDLVLIDEICAGTDPNEGAALAMAMLEHLHEQGVLTMVTTHYSELKTFAYGHEGMENASVEFDPVSLRPTYRLLMGVPGSSNAFNISRRLGLAEDIIKNAGELLNQEHVHMENVLQELDSERRRYESGSKEIEDLRRESEQLRNALAYSKSEFERRKNEMLRKAREQADEIYRRSRRESEAVLKELRSMKADFDTKRLEQAAEEARKKLNKTLSEDAPLPEGAPLSAKTAKKGLNVFVVSLGKNGIITDVNGNDVTVQVGILKMTVPAKKCLLTKAQPAHTDAAPKKRKGFSKNAAANYAHQMFIAKSGSAKQEIDLRGMTLDEAIPVVDKAIDDALIACIGQLRLIHGKGTGALRAGLTAYLSTNRFVKKLETAALEAGGSGATVIDL